MKFIDDKYAIPDATPLPIPINCKSVSWSSFSCEKKKTIKDLNWRFLQFSQLFKWSLHANRTRSKFCLYLAKLTVQFYKPYVDFRYNLNACMRKPNWEIHGDLWVTNFRRVILRRYFMFTRFKRWSTTENKIRQIVWKDSDLNEYTNP